MRVSEEGSEDGCGGEVEGRGVEGSGSTGGEIEDGGEMTTYITDISGWIEFQAVRGALTNVYGLTATGTSISASDTTFT